MFEPLLLSSILITQSPNYDPDFILLQNKLEQYNFTVNIALPPNFQLPSQRSDFQRRRVRKPYGLLNSSTQSIWINPIVFELGIGNSVLVHETVHAAQFCLGNGKLTTLKLDLEPIQQARPFFKRYIDTHSQAIEKEAYAVQTQPNSFELAVSLLDKYCGSKQLTINN